MFTISEFFLNRWTPFFHFSSLMHWCPGLFDVSVDALDKFKFRYRALHGLREAELIGDALLGGCVQHGKPAAYRLCSKSWKSSLQVVGNARQRRHTKKSSVTTKNTGRFWGNMGNKYLFFWLQTQLWKNWVNISSHSQMPITTRLWLIHLKTLAHLMQVIPQKFGEGSQSVFKGKEPIKTIQSFSVTTHLFPGQPKENWQHLPYELWWDLLEPCHTMSFCLMPRCCQRIIGI